VSAFRRTVSGPAEAGHYRRSIHSRGVRSRARAHSSFRLAPLHV